MLFSAIIRNVVHRKSTGLRFASTEEIKKYKTSSKALAQWLDVSIVSKKGRAFDADADLVVKSKAEVFPTAKVFNLDGQSISIPDDIDAKAKLVVVSFKGYGFNLLRTWIDPFIARFNNPVPAIADGGKNFTVNDIVKPLSKPNGALAFEICFVEYGFLSFAKSIFASNIRNNVDPSQVNRTGMIFGGAKVRVLLIFIVCTNIDTYNHLSCYINASVALKIAVLLQAYYFFFLLLVIYLYTLFPS